MYFGMINMRDSGYVNECVRDKYTILLSIQLLIKQENLLIAIFEIIVLYD